MQLDHTENFNAYTVEMINQVDLAIRQRQEEISRLQDLRAHLAEIGSLKPIMPAAPPMQPPMQPAPLPPLPQDMAQRLEDSLQQHPV